MDSLQFAINYFRANPPANSRTALLIYSRNEYDKDRARDVDHEAGRPMSGPDNVATPDAAPPPAPKGPDTAALVALGHSLNKREDWSGALEAFQRAHQASPANTGILNEIGYLLLRLARPTEAEAAFRAIAERDATNRDAMTGLAYAFRAQGARAKALEHFEAASSAAPDRVDLIIEVAHELRALRRYDDAEAAYRRALAAAPERSDILNGLAQALRGRGDLEAALAVFMSAASANPADLGLRNAIGYLLRDMKRPREAEAMFRGILEQAPAHGGARVGLGFALIDRGDLAGALQAFEAAGRDDPGAEPVRFQIAQLLRRLRRLDESEAAFRRILSNAPGNVVAMTELARIAMARGDAAGAIATLRAAIAIRDDDVSQRIEFGWLAREIGRAEEAAEAFNFALTRAPAHSGAFSGLGWLAVDAHRLDEARQCFERALDAAPDNVGCQLALGHLARRRSDRVAARAAFEAALRIDPDSVDAHLEVAAEARDRGEFTLARATIEALVASHPESVAARVHLAQWHQSRGDAAEALRAIEPALIADPPQPRVLLAAGAFYRTLGEPQRARELVERALAIEPRNLEALIQKTDSALASERFDEALESARATLDAHPRQIWPYLQAARAASALGDDAQAAALLDEATLACGPHPEIAATRVQFARLSRDWPRALDALAAATDAGGAFIWTEGMLVALSIGDFGGVEEALERVPSGSTHDAARVHLFRAQSLEAQRRYDDAIKQYRAAARLDPNDSWTQGEMARACLIGLDVDFAAESLKRSVRLDASGHIQRGQTLKASQHHLGQIIDEFLLDSHVLREMCDARRLEAHEHVGALRDIVRRNPDHTAPAMLLMIALRQNNYFAPRAETGGGAAAIPRRIIQFWDSGEPPHDIRNLMQTWRDHNPDYEPMLFDDASAKSFLARRLPLDVARAFARARHPAQRADIFRLAVLCMEGGFYLDADDRCLSPLERFAPDGASLALYQENYGTIGNDAIGATAGHPIIAHALALAVEAINGGDGDTLWLSTGPGLITRALAHAVAGLVPDAVDWRRGMIVHEHYEAQRLIGLHCPVRYKRTARHWLRANDRRIAAE
jgi:tetratricopeptide (TPR) repeat protein